MYRSTLRPQLARRRRTFGLRGLVAIVLLVISTTSGFSLAVANGFVGSASTGPAPTGPTIPVVPAAKAVPSLVVAPTSGPIGTPVTFSVSGFAINKAITIKDATWKLVCSGKTTSKGVFTCDYTIPLTHGGPEKFTAATTKNNETATFTVESTLTVSPADGPVGTPVRFSGTGFGGPTVYQVEVTWTGPTGSTLTACSANTDASGNGSFDCSFVLSAAPGGAHLFTAGSTVTGETGFTATVQFVVKPSLSVGPSNGPPGTPVTFTGTGFGSLVSASVTWSGGTACSATTLASGNLSCSTTIPTGTAGGSYVFTGKDALGNSATTSFVVTYLDVSPSTVVAGDTLTLSGGGFKPSTLLALNWTYGPVCPGTTSTISGTFSCAYGPFPATPHGAYFFTASDGVGDHASARIAVAATLGLNATHGDPGTDLLLSGTGFASLVSVNVTWSGTPAQVCEPGSASDGAFSCPFTVPLATAGGPYSFVATDTASNSATAAFTVTYLSASPVSGPKGTSVTLQGGGFTPGSTFSVTWGTTAVPTSDCTTTTVSSSGAIRCTFKTPGAPAGPRAFTAIDATHDSATAPFTVLPHLTVGPTRGNVTSHLTLTMTGFAAAASVTVTWANGTAACPPAVTNTTGSASCTLELAPTPAGGYVLQARDTDSDNASAVFTVVPAFWVAPGHGLGGTSVEFYGTGFGDNVSVTVSSSLGSTCLTTTSKVGSFSCPYTVPYAPNGSYAFKALDAVANNATTHFAITPELTVSSSKGPVGTLLTFRGFGFGAGRTANVSWSSGLACQAAVGASGEFTCSFTVTAAPKATYTFAARDRSAGRGGNFATASFAIIPSATVTPSSGPVGTSVTFSGQGYLADAFVAVDGPAGFACSEETAASGSFSCSYVIPGVPAGAHEFTVSSSSTDSANTTFTVLPKLSISRPSGPVGTEIGLDASGFAASAWLNLSWSEGIACSGQASPQGLYSCEYVIAAASQGSHAFTAIVAGLPVASVDFVVQPSLALSPTAGPDGTPVQFSALGFAASESITVSSSLGTSCVGSTSARGSFACNYTIPTAAAGTYSFLAKDALSNNASAPFVVGSVLRVSPKSGVVGSSIELTATGFKGSAPIDVNWTGGTACSGTTGPGGGFSCNTTVPLAPFGPLVFTARAGPVSSATFGVRPSLKATPASGPAGGSAVFSGEGFPSSTSVTVRWSGSTSCSGLSNASGQFACSLSIPISTAGGTYGFTASDGLGHEANTTFTVVTGLVDAPSHGPARTIVTFTATNLADQVPVYLNWSGGVACSGLTTLSGGFTCQYTIPDHTPGGAYRFSLANATLNLSVRFIVTYLNATRTGLVPGQSVSLAGGGFEPEAGYTVVGPWGSVCAGVADDAGAFSCQAVVPITASPGAYNFTANDSFGDVATAGFGVFSIGSPMAAPPSVDVNESVTFSIAASGGAGNLTYHWSGLPAGCPPSNSSSISCQPTGASSGPLSITVVVVDAEGFAVTSSALAFTVFPDPSVHAPKPDVGSADVGQSVSFSTTGSVGSGGPVYAWSESATGINCTLGSLASVSCRPAVPGNYTVSVNVTDSNGVSSATKASAVFRVFTDPTTSAPSASRSQLDVGQSVSFTTAAHGGSGGDSFTWTWPSALGCAPTHSAALACTPTPGASGAYSVSVTVTDSNGETSASMSSADVTVSSAPTASTPSANRSAADVGQSVSISTTASGGTGTYTYQWSITPAGLNCTNLNQPTISCVPASPGRYAINVTVTDGNGATSAVASLAPYVVSSRPAVGTPSASPTSVDLRQSVTFSVKVTGGSGSLSYVWSGLPIGCASTAASFTCTPTAAVSAAPVNVTVTDSNGVNATSATLFFSVYNDPSRAPPAASRSAGDIGQPVTFSAIVSNGSGGGTYSWWWGGTASGLNCTATAGATLSCSPSSVGDYTVSYAWTDSNGVGATGGNATSYLVSPDPVLTRPSPAPGSVDVGQTVVFSTTLSGGAPGTPTYTWSETPSGLNCTASSGPSLTCTPKAAGNYTVSVYATDANDRASETVSVTFHLFTDPTVSAPTPSAPSVNVGEKFTFTATAHGGSGGDTFAWSPQATLTALGCSASVSGTLSCQPTSKAAGNDYTVSVTVTDSNSRTSAVASGSVSVLAAVTTTAPSPSRPAADVGQGVVFSTSASGGSGGYTFAWTVAKGPGLNCTLTTSDSISCTPNGTGSFSVSVIATDSDGGSSAAATLSAYVVSSDPSVTSLTPSAVGGLDLPGKVLWTAVASGGAGTLTYSWVTSSRFSCTVVVASPDEDSCTPTAAGVFWVNVTVTDANGLTSPLLSSGAYSVYAKPVARLDLSSSSVLQGQSVTFDATVTGGEPGTVAVLWTNLPGGCTAPTNSLVYPVTSVRFSCTPGSGQFKVEVMFTDALKGTAEGYANLTVRPSFIGLPATEGYALVICAVIAGIAGASYLVLRRMRRRRSDRQSKEY